MVLIVAGGQHGQISKQFGQVAQSFHLLIQFVVFTSILDLNYRQTVAQEMLRVLKPGGAVIWYDFHIDNPRNPDVKGVNRKDIERLFPNCSIVLQRSTLAPPLARWIVPRSFLIAYALEKIPILRTHYLGLIFKQEEEALK